jgi:transcription elongation factor GreA
MIVSSIEQDPFLKKCSNHSPVGKALLGHRAGETVLVQNIDHPYNIKITSVE